jgi:monoamine oxidase
MVSRIAAAAARAIFFACDAMPAPQRIACRHGLGHGARLKISPSTIMPKLSRRRFVAASAASAAGAAAPAWGATGPDAEIVVIGAGAAGIAAARRVASAKARLIVLEANDRIGGRCFTETTTFGVPYDRGAHWIHTPELNPITPLVARTGLDVYPAPPAQKLRIGRRNAREIEMEDYLASVVRANRAIIEAGRGRTDVSCGAALPKDLADWQPAIEFVLGPFGCAKNLSDVSAADFAKSAERDVDQFCRQGFGALIANLAQGLPVQLSNPVKAIDLSGRAYVEIRTARGTITARAVIVTASTGVLLDNRIRFEPELPRRYTDALARLTLGSYDHIALELPGNPLGLARDEVVFEKSSSARTAAILANVSGTTLCMVEVGGKFGRELSGQGGQAMVEFALDWLTGLYGSEVKKAVKRTHATQWNREPWALGAFSAAAPGGQPSRMALAEPFHDRLWFAGEAIHETLWGSVGGAWASGERAALQALRKIGAVAEPPPEPQVTGGGRRRR